MRRVPIVIAAMLSLAGALVVAPSAQAADAPIPSKLACSKGVGAVDYACLAVTKSAVPSGDPAVFTGSLSKKARKNLALWTKGDNIICLQRYKTKPESDGWPSTTLEGACATVRKDGGFAIAATLGRKGTFYYGITMGPCRGDAGLCGNGDPGLLGVGSNHGNKVVSLTTT